MQARTQRLESHLYDLFQLIPGLEAISEMLLGVRSYNSSSVPILQPDLPHSEDALESMNHQEDRYLRFRASAVGKIFDDGLIDTNDLVAGDEGSIDKIESIKLEENSRPPKRTKLSPVSDDFGGPSTGHWPFPAMSGGRQEHSQEQHQSSSQWLSQSMLNSIDGILNDFATDAEGSNLSGSPSILSTPFNQYHLPFDVVQTTPTQTLPTKIVWEDNSPSGCSRAYGTTSGFTFPGRAPKSTSLSAVKDLLTPIFPSQMICARLIDTYLTVVHPNLPMCSRLLLMQWSSNPMSYADLQLAPELIFAILAVALPYFPLSSLDDSTPPTQTISVDSFSTLARSFIGQAAAHPSLSTCQALLLLTLSDWGQGEFSLAWSNLGTPRSKKVLGRIIYVF